MLELSIELDVMAMASLVGQLVHDDPLIRLPWAWIGGGVVSEWDRGVVSCCEEVSERLSEKCTSRGEGAVMAMTLDDKPKARLISAYT